MLNKAEKIRIIENAFNSDEINKSTHLYYNDNLTIIVDDYIIKGKQELRGASEWDSVLNTHLIFSDFKIGGDSVICKCTEENDLSKLQGLDKGFYKTSSIRYQWRELKRRI